MAIDAKVSFLREMEKQGAERIPQATMQQVLAIASDVLEGYDIVERERCGTDGADDLLDAFIAAMNIQGRSVLTIKRYTRMLKIFLEYAKAPTRRISVYHVRNWLASEKQRGLQDSSLDGYRMILSSYFGWLFREGLIERNPMTNIGPIKVAKKKKKIYSAVDMTRMQDACRTVRDRAIILFLAATGCRVSEMIQLNREDVNLKDQECIVHGKGDKERRVYFDSVTAMMLEEYLEGRTDDCEALFAGKGGVRLMQQGVRDMLKRIEKRTGIERIHPHKFRRTLASDLARHGMPVQVISSILGHEKIDTTMTYVVLDQENVRSDYRRFA